MARTQPARTAQTDPIRKSSLSNLLGLSESPHLDALLKSIEQDRQKFELDQRIQSRQKEDDSIRSTMHVLHTPVPRKYQDIPASTSYKKDISRSLPPGNATYENSTVSPWILVLASITVYLKKYNCLPRSIYFPDSRIEDLIKDTAYCTRRPAIGCVFEFPEGDGESYTVIPVRSDNLLRSHLNPWTVLCSNHV